MNNNIIVIFNNNNNLLKLLPRQEAIFVHVKFTKCKFNLAAKQNLGKGGRKELKGEFLGGAVNFSTILCRGNS